MCNKESPSENTLNPIKLHGSIFTRKRISIDRRVIQKTNDGAPSLSKEELSKIRRGFE
jgi:hypothetical protein